MIKLIPNRSNHATLYGKVSSRLSIRFPESKIYILFSVSKNYLLFCAPITKISTGFFFLFL